MSSPIFIRNRSHSADLGVLSNADAVGGRRGTDIHGINVYIPADTVFTDPTGAIWRTLKGDSDSFFFNCADAQEAIRLSVPKEKWGYVNQDGEAFHRGPGAPDGHKFVGFFGALHVLADDTGNKTALLTATADRAASIRHLQRMEEDLALSQKVQQDQAARIEQLLTIVEQQKAELLVIKSKAGDKEAQKELAARVEKAKAAAAKPAAPAPQGTKLQPGSPGALID
jgi:hypothetical protein